MYVCIYVSIYKYMYYVYYILHIYIYLVALTRLVLVFLSFRCFPIVSQPVFTCSKPKMETPEQSVKYVQI